MKLLKQHPNPKKKDCSIEEASDMPIRQSDRFRSFGIHSLSTVDSPSTARRFDLRCQTLPVYGTLK
jgi:hypothetical protein